MKKDLILVVGASGTVGSEVVRILKANGHSVRQATSQPSTKTDLVQVNLATKEGISQAFAGVDKAFFLSPPGFTNQYEILSPLIQQAQKSHLKKVVLMTALGANASESTPFRRAEIELEKSGLIFNIVRPNWFMQNFNTFWIQGIREQGKILLPAGKAKTSFIDARDISAVIAQLLITDQFQNQAFDLTGPQALEHGEVAQELTSAIGKPIHYQEIAPIELKRSLLKAGLPEDYSDFLLVILGYLKEGYNSGITDNVRKILGREPKTLKTYIQDYRSAWL